MTASLSEKALRYIAALDQVRCHGQWLQVPELARKVEKHAPQRKTLVLVARSEATVSTTDVSDRQSALSTLIGPLHNAIARETAFPEDAFQASVCLAWIRWLLQEPQNVPEGLVDDFAQTASRVTGKGALSVHWVQICAIKGAYLKGFSLEKTGKAVEAERSYYSAVPIVSANSTNPQGASGREYRIWAERLLCRCIAQPMNAGHLDQSADFDKLLKIFHLWTGLMSSSTTNARPVTSAGIIQTAPEFQLGLEVEYSRWDMWMAYYATLSEILKRNLIYSPTYSETNPQILPPGSELSDHELQAARLRQRTEIKSVESSIESKLLDETSFPKANVRNEKVERWVDAVMENWRIMCGPNWLDEDLGQGGKNAIARGVLDILYRAATKTFHSTLILRHLFTVHAYLAEFDLAMKALDTYLEMVTKARARAEKSNEPDFSLDDNDKVLSTMSDAILLVCRYGTREEVEKIRTTSGKLLHWVQESQVRPEISESARVNGVVIDPVGKSASPATIAQAYHALGSSEAQWSRVTYEASSRTTHQNKALEHYRMALHRRYRQSKNLDYIYSMAVLMAEMRDINGAIKTVKQALAESSTDGPLAPPFDDTYETERKLIRFWHLLTLLLSARADLLNAAKASNAAFEQFRDPGILFGQQEYRSEHLNETEKATRPRSNALVDKMDTMEKTGILQVKMTQVALLEALEGPNSAVDASLDLLALYARLYGEPEQGSIIKATGSTTKLPKSRVGSIRARFSRATSRRRKDTAKGDEPARPATSATMMAPKIQVTDVSIANEARGRTSNGIRPVSTPGPVELKKHKVSRSLSRTRAGERRKNSFQSADSLGSVSQATHYTDAREEVSDNETNGTVTNGRSSRNSINRPSTSTSIMTKSTMGWRGRSSKRDSRFSMQTIDSDGATTAVTQQTKPMSLIPDPADKKLRNCVLVELWLFVAGMYRRSELFDDADDSIKEAEKLVAEIEGDVALVSSSAKSFGDSGWGGAKSVDELWGDIWSERGHLSRAQSLPHQAMDRYERALGFCANHTGGIVGISELLLDIYDEKMAPEADEPLLDYLNVGAWNEGGLDGAGSVADTSTIKGSIATGMTSTSALARAAATSNATSNSAVAAARARETVSAPLSRSHTSGSIAVGSLSSTPGPNTNRPGSPQSAIAAITSSPPLELANRRPSIVPGVSVSSVALSAASASKSVASTIQSVTSDVQAVVSVSPSSEETGNEPSPEFLARLAARDRAYLLLSTLTKLGTGWDCSEAWFGLARAYEASGQVDKAKEVLWWCVELEDSKPLRNWGCVGVL